MKGYGSNEGPSLNHSSALPPEGTSVDDTDGEKEVTDTTIRIPKQRMRWRKKIVDTD